MQLILSREALEATRVALDDQMCVTREKCASVVRTVSCSIPLHIVTALPGWVSGHHQNWEQCDDRRIP